MSNPVSYWKNIALNMLVAFQGLFIASTTWDFFLTVVVKESHRALVFSTLAPAAATFIIVPWILGILFLAAMLAIYSFNKDSIIASRIHYEYSGMTVLYMFLFVLGCLSASISWPLLLNYAVNCVWAISLVYFRIVIQKGIDQNIGGPERRRRFGNDITPAPPPAPPPLVL